MRKLAVWLCLLALSVVPLTTPGQTVNSMYSFTDFTTHPLNVSQVAFTPLDAGLDYTNNVLSPIPIPYTRAAYPTLTNGSLTISNIICGYAYRVAFSDGYGTPAITNYFPASLTNDANGKVSGNAWKTITLIYEQGRVKGYVLASISGYAFTTNYLTITNLAYITNTFNITNNVSGGTNLTVSATTSSVPAIVGMAISIPTNYEATGSSAIERAALLATNTAILNVATNLTTAERAALIASNTVILNISTNLSATERAALIATNGSLMTALAAGTNAALGGATVLTTAERAALLATNTAILNVATNLTTTERAALVASNTVILTISTNLSATERAALVASNTAALTISTNLTATERAALIATNSVIMAQISASNAPAMLAATNVGLAERAALVSTNNQTLVTVTNFSGQALTASTNLVTVERAALIATNSSLMTALSAGTNAALGGATVLTVAERAAMIATNTAILNVATNLTTAERAAIIASNTVILNISTNLSATERAALIATNGSLMAALAAGTNAALGGATVLTLAERAALLATNTAILNVATNLITAERAALAASNTVILTISTNLSATERAALIATNSSLMTALAAGTNAALGGATVLTAAERAALLATNTIILTTATNLTTAERAALIASNTVILTISTNLSATERAALIATNSSLMTALAAGTNAALGGATVLTVAERATLLATNMAILNVATNLTTAERAALVATNSALLSTIALSNAPAMLAATNVGAAERAALLATNTATLAAATNLTSSVSNWASATLLPRTNGTAQGLTVMQNFNFNGGTNLSAWTNSIGVIGSVMAGVDGTYYQSSASLWTNMNMVGFDVALSASNLYSFRSNAVTLLTCWNLPTNSLRPTIAGTGSGLAWWGSYKEQNGQVDIGYFNNTNAVWQWRQDIAGASNTLAALIATNSANGPLQASNLTGSVVGVLQFTNGSAGQVLVKLGGTDWGWTNQAAGTNGGGFPLITNANAAGFNITNIGNVGTAGSISWGNIPTSAQLGTYTISYCLGYWRGSDSVTNDLASWEMTAFNTQTAGGLGKFGFINTYNGNNFEFSPEGRLQANAFYANHYFELNGIVISNWTDITAGLTGPTNGITSTTATNIADGEIARLVTTATNISGYALAQVTNIASAFGGGAATNAIGNSYGHGTNTSIGFMAETYTGNPITLAGTNVIFTNSALDFYQDPNTNDITGICTADFSYITALWTNATYTNWTITYSYFDYSPIKLFTFRTNADCIFGSFFSKGGSPVGQWWSANGTNGACYGTTIPSATNYNYITIISNGAFMPIIVRWPIIDISQYSYPHGLGHVPALVKWYWYAVAVDGNLHYPVGTEIELESFHWGGIYDTLYANTNEATWNLPGSLDGVEGSYVTTPYHHIGGDQASPASWTNWNIEAKIFP